MNAKLKKFKESGSSKDKHHANIQPEDIQRCYVSDVFAGDSSISLLRVNWFEINLHLICRRGGENQGRNIFVFNKDASEVEYVEMAYQEKTKKIILAGLAEQGCQLSRIIRGYQDFEPYLPVSRCRTVMSRF